MKKKASDLVKYCLAQIGRPYWLGGFGQAASRDLYEQNKNRLKYGSWEGDYERHVGQKVHDCCGLVKGFVWTDGPDIPWRAGQYKINGMNGDWGVAEQYEKCTKKGDISSIPEIPGLLVFTKNMSHMGVYIGNGEVVEARGHAYGVQRNKLKDRNFALWGRLDCCIDYDTEKTTVDGNKIKAFQQWINSYLPIKYLGIKLEIDGKYGALTRKAAIKALQYWLNSTYSAGLAVDGGYGPLTKAKTPLLVRGNKGPGVYILQGLLYAKGYDPKGFDGSFGASGGMGCYNAVKAYQADNGLEVDGKAGGETFGKLFDR